MIYKFTYGDNWKMVKFSGTDKPYGKLEPQIMSKSQEKRYREELAAQWNCRTSEIKLEEINE